MPRKLSSTSRKPNSLWRTWVIRNTYAFYIYFSCLIWYYWFNHTSFQVKSMQFPFFPESQFLFGASSLKWQTLIFAHLNSPFLGLVGWRLAGWLVGCFCFVLFCMEGASSSGCSGSNSSTPIGVPIFHSPINPHRRHWDDTHSCLISASGLASCKLLLMTQLSFQPCSPGPFTEMHRAATLLWNLPHPQTLSWNYRSQSLSHRGSADLSCPSYSSVHYLRSRGYIFLSLLCSTPSATSHLENILLFHIKALPHPCFESQRIIFSSKCFCFKEYLIKSSQWDSGFEEHKCQKLRPFILSLSRSPKMKDWLMFSNYGLSFSTTIIFFNHLNLFIFQFCLSLYK